MNTVKSKDGTAIAYDRVGEGPPVILVSGALGTRLFDMSNAPLATLLEPHLTVYSYDRRGRRDSGDTQPYAVGREVEDIAALVKVAGGEAYAYGLSSGAALALEAARRIPGITRLAMYEPPYIVDASRPPLPADYVQHLNELVAAGRRGDAVEYFMTAAAGVPAEWAAAMRNEPFWPAMEAVAHTIAYDGMVMGDTMSGKPLPAEWASLTTPTLVLNGGDGEAWMRDSADALANLLPNARRRTLPGQTHGVAADALAPVLIEFFTR